MSKYYVQSGTLRAIIAAESSSKAAIWAVHQTMQQVFPIDEETLQDDHPSPAKLAKDVWVSEQGFDREDAVRTSTLQVVSQWNEMVMALDRLEKMLHRAA